MRRVRYSVAMSLDGFIAGRKGEHDWIVMDPEIDFRSSMARFDTILMGRKTYEASRGHKGGGMPGMSAIVFSKTLKAEDCKGVTVSAAPADTIAAMKAKGGKDIWLFGGGGLFRSLLDLGLVDSVEVAIIPVVLGSGVPLVPEGAKQKLALVKHQVYAKTGTVSLEYEPRRD